MLNLNQSIERMTGRLCDALEQKVHSIWLYGSVVLDDFRPGWSDIDMLVLAGGPVTEQQARQLVGLRQAMLEINRMGELARDNFSTALDYFFDPSQERLYDQVMERETTVDWLDHAISDKLVTLRSLQLSDNDVFRLSRLVNIGCDGGLNRFAYFGE